MSTIEFAVEQVVADVDRRRNETKAEETEHDGAVALRQMRRERYGEHERVLHPVVWAKQENVP